MSLLKFRSTVAGFPFLNRSFSLLPAVRSPYGFQFAVWNLFVKPCGLVCWFPGLLKLTCFPAVPKNFVPASLNLPGSSLAIPSFSNHLISKLT
jgi:hypothetical protein